MKQPSLLCLHVQGESTKRAVHGIHHSLKRRAHAGHRNVDEVRPCASRAEIVSEGFPGLLGREDFH